METNQAAENLQVIRTLMERSAVYRRALAPVMLFVGGIGIATALGGFLGALSEGRLFLWLWLVASGVALGGAFLLIRRQAFRDAEPFWTPPTRRVVEAIAPPLFLGGVVTLVSMSPGCLRIDTASQLLPPIWMALYGCALHAAGFFMPRGIKWLGWMFLLLGGLLMLLQFGLRISWPAERPYIGNLLMGASFGGLNLAYGLYLNFTEQRKNVA